MPSHINRAILTTHELGLSKPIRKRIKQAAKKRPKLVEIKNSPLHVLPCQSECVESKCEHYRDCLSLINMFEFLIANKPDPEAILKLYKFRNRAIDSWQKKGFFRSCMFKVPHVSPILAQRHVDLLQQADSNSCFYSYKCAYGNHYHVAHTRASAASLRQMRETILG